MSPGNELVLQMQVALRHEHLTEFCVVQALVAVLVVSQEQQRGLVPQLPVVLLLRCLDESVDEFIELNVTVFVFVEDFEC